jgi:AraC-like DNA-binding protein
MGFSTTSSHPNVTVVEISDVTAASAGLDLFQQDAMSLQSEPLRVRRIIVRLPAVIVVYHSTNRRVRVRTRGGDGWLAYDTFGPRSGGAVEGIRVRPGMLVVAEPGTQVGFVAEPGYESIALFVRPDCLREYLSARQRQDEFHLPRQVEVVSADPALVQALFRLGKRLTTMAARTPRKFDEGRAERVAAEAELLEALLVATRTTVAVEPSGTERTRRTYTRIVDAAERHAITHAGERVQVSDLCRVADVSERTLEGAFMEVTGMSPVAYLRRLRLHRVREELLAAEPRSTRVSAAALKWGFWHFGEFSRAYKQCFGESPSVTLRSAPAGPKSR